MHVPFVRRRPSIAVVPFALLTAACGGTASSPAPKAADETANVTPKRSTSTSASTKSAPYRIIVPRPKKALARVRPFLGNSQMSTAIEALLGLVVVGDSGDPDRPWILTSAGGKEIAFSPAIVPGSQSRVRALLEKAGWARALKKDGAPGLVCDVVQGTDGPRAACASDQRVWETLVPSAIDPPSRVTTDIHVELDGALLMQRAGEKPHAKSDGTPTFNAGYETGAAMARRFGDDFERISLEVRLDGTPEVELAFHVKGKDPFTRTLVQAPVAPPPPSFGRLPADAEMAMFAHAAPGAAASPARDALEKLFFDGCTEDERRALHEEMGKLLFTGGSVAFATGFDRGRAEEAARAVTKGSPDPRAVERRRAALRSWTFFALEEPADRWVSGIARVNDIKCEKITQKGESSENAANRDKDKDDTPTKTRVVKTSPGLRLPAGTLELVTQPVKPAGPPKKATAAATPKPPKPPKPNTYVFVIPEGTTRTWIAIGHDEAALAARIRGMLDGKSPRLESRAALDGLRQPASAAGFVSAGGLAWMRLEERATSDAVVADGQQILELAAMPTGARTPVPLIATATSDGKGGELRLRARLDSAAIADMLAVFSSQGSDSESESEQGD